MADKYSTQPIRIGEGRLAFVSVFDKAKNRETGLETRYETTLLLPPGYNTQPILDMLWEAWEMRWTKDKKKWPVGTRLNPLRMPEDVIRSCEEKAKFAGYLPGWHFITAGSQQYKPTVLDRTQPYDTRLKSFPVLTDDRKAECYAGRWAFISANAYTYINQSTGVTLGLSALLLGKNDEPLAGGGGAGTRAFDDIAEEVIEDNPLG
jgi:hypothetical protein